MTEKKLKRNSIETRQKIISVAENIFATKGYQGASMRDIASDVGIKAATLYYYFPSKNDLIKNLFENFYEKLNDLYCQMNSDLSKDLKLAALMKRFKKQHYEFLEENPNFSSLFFLGIILNEDQVLSDFKDIALPAAKSLKKLSKRCVNVPANEVMICLLGIIGTNIFFFLSKNYIKNIQHLPLSAKKQHETLTNLFTGQYK